jgi:hypothetical protein
MHHDLKHLLERYKSPIVFLRTILRYGAPVGNSLTPNLNFVLSRKAPTQTSIVVFFKVSVFTQCLIELNKIVSLNIWFKIIKQFLTIVLFYKKYQITIVLHLLVPKYITSPIVPLSLFSTISSIFYFLII